jgi:hypothetical protein
MKQGAPTAPQVFTRRFLGRTDLCPRPQSDTLHARRAASRFEYAKPTRRQNRSRPLMNLRTSSLNASVLARLSRSATVTSLIAAHRIRTFAPRFRRLNGHWC